LPNAISFAARTNESLLPLLGLTIVQCLYNFRKKVENDNISRGQSHGQTNEDRFSADDSDDEMLSSVIK